MAYTHQKQWDFLKNNLKANQLSHAYLFVGQNKIGKNDFAKEFIKFINCKGEDKPCKKCFNCLAIEKNSFPDSTCVKSEDGGEIEVSKIRQIQNFLSYKPYYGSIKSVIVQEADKMNQEAQNCFLKTLEEPKGSTLIILISSKPELLLPTIFSRCQQIKFFGKPELNQQDIEKEKSILKEFLKITNSSLSEKFKYAKAVDSEERNVSEILQALEKYYRYILFLKSGINDSELKNYMPEPPQSLMEKPISKLKEDIKLIENINNKITFTNANSKLALEVLLMNI